MSTFLESLTKLAQPVSKPATGVKRDPLEVMRGKFLATADEQIKLIKSSADKSRWFRKQPDDSYILSLRNGNALLAIDGNTHFSVTSANNAVKFLETAKKAAQGGELDEMLKKTAFTRKPKSTEKPKK